MRSFAELFLLDMKKVSCKLDYDGWLKTREESLSAMALDKSYRENLLITNGNKYSQFHILSGILKSILTYK